MGYVSKAMALINLVAAIAPEANSIPLPNSSIAARRGSCNNDSALAALRHGTLLSGGKRPSCVFWQASLSPRATGGSMS